ncbi:MAG: ABC transporter ATP-binding protein [Lachnospiraceae bacterium]|nr:ABC transporter ATP-binding protein [Lachnospiraceae bacterium]
MVIEFNHLYKQYNSKSKWALEDINYSCDNLEPLGVIGNNGAGKTTLFMVSNGFIHPTSGDVYIHGVSLRQKEQISKMTGLFTDQLRLYAKLTVKETIQYFMGIYNISNKEYEGWVRRFHIKEYEKKKIPELSRGMFAKVMLLISMLNYPEVLFLDEPFWGLDVESKSELSEIILQLYTENKVKVVIASQDLYETQELIQDLIILEKGKIIESGRYHSLIQKYSKNALKRVVCENDREILEKYESYMIQKDEEQLTLELNLVNFNEFMADTDTSKIINILNHDMSLEDVYREAKKNAVMGFDK